MTSRELTNNSLRLIGSIDQSGNIQADRNVDYYNLAPGFISTIQEEIAIHQGITLMDEIITNLDDELEISDKACQLCAQYFLAFMFANIDGETNLAQNYFNLYTKNLSYIRPQNSTIQRDV